MKLFAALFILWAAAIAGWVMNIVALVHLTSFTSGMAVLRVIGIFVAPLGAILGFC